MATKSELQNRERTLQKELRELIGNYQGNSDIFWVKRLRLSKIQLRIWKIQKRRSSQNLRG